MKDRLEVTLSRISSTILLSGAGPLFRPYGGRSGIFKLNRLGNWVGSGLGVCGGDSPSTAVCGRKRVAMITLWFLYELMVGGESPAETEAVRRNLR
jgi:hypothetical protein